MSLTTIPLYGLTRRAQHGSDYVRFALDLTSGAWSSEKTDTVAAAVAGACGIADVATAGLLLRKNAFAAMWADHENVHVFVDGTTMTFPGPYKTRRVAVAPFIKRFEVSRDAKSILTINYWQHDSEWPPAESQDVFLAVHRTTSSEHELRRFILWWSLVAAGSLPWTSEFQKQIEEFDRAR